MPVVSPGIVAALCAVLLAAATVRFMGLADRPVGHVEMYSPNLPLPAGVSEPPPRLSLVKTVTGSFWEPHPPFWYAATYFWTALFGTGPVAMRTPSVITGLIGVALIFLVGWKLRSPAVGLVAAALLAAHGLHIQWSQMARPVIYVSTFGLLSTWMLMRWLREPASRPRLFVYGLVSLAGMATDYYFWLLFAAHTIWIALLATSARRLFDAFQWQAVVLFFASPLLALAAFQTKESYLRSDVIEAGARYLGFGNLFTHEPTTVDVGPVPMWMATALGTAAIAVALWRRRERWDVSARIDASFSPSPSTLLVTFGAGLVATATAAYVFFTVQPVHKYRLMGASLAPVVFLAAALIARRLSQRDLGFRLPALDPVIAFAVIPALLAAAVSIVTPFIDPKYILVFTPFMLIWAADGLVGVLRAVNPRAAVALGAVLIAVLGWLHVEAYRQQSGSEDTPAHWQRLGQRMTPRLRDGDVVLTYTHWAMTPVYYYLPRGTRYATAQRTMKLRETGSPRIWMLSLRDTNVPDPPGLAAAVQGCQLVEAFVERRIRAELYEDCPRLLPSK